MVKGKHIPLITKDIFYVVQKIKHGKKAFIKKQKGKNEYFPLTGFMKCADCGATMYGSQSNNGKKKKVTRTYNYYHCNSKCKCRRYRAEIVHQELYRTFECIKPTEEVLDLFQQILIDEYENTKKERLKDEMHFDKHIQETSRNQLKLTEKYALGKIKENMYNQLMTNYENELIDLRTAKAELGDYQKDLDQYLAFGMTLLTNLDVFFKNASVEMKTRLLGSIFNEKLEFFENGFRTQPFNEAILLLCKYNKAFKRELIKKGSIRKDVSHIVLKAGLEPTITKLKDLSFLTNLL